jgi:chaperone required for assembly of F1-ATPase
VRAGRLDSAGAMAAACLDEDHQQARWGVDAEAAERRRRLTQESERLERWFHALDVAASGG